jgi:hypothetical protein
MTAKHLKANSTNDSGNKYLCTVCSRVFQHASSLSRHKKKCIISTLVEETNENTKEPIKENNNENEVILIKNLLLEIVKNNSELQKQNQELQQQVIDICKNTNNTINNNTTISNNNNNNSHNKTFNLQFFLNEQCKDAMNIMDFVNSVTLQLSDLESVGQLGYVEGITKIMIKKLTEMDIYKRPVHCSDAKREIIHIKDNDVWEKEDVTYPKLRRAIKYISKKNSDLLLVWSAKYPESKNIYSKVNETYMIMVHQAMGGTGEVTENENKIIKKISKMILIDK